MVEIKYRSSYEVADLKGQSVAHARELFHEEFSIPGKAKARLNGRKISEEMESQTELKDNDSLSFAVDKGKMPLLVGAMLLALAATGGVFAYTATTDTATVGVVAQSDFATVTDNKSDNVSAGTWDVFGQYKGTLPDGNLFTIYPADGYPGDLIATLSLGNADDLVKAYRVMVWKIEVTDNASGSVTDGVLTLSKGELELPIDVQGNPSSYYQVRSNGGFYVSPLWAGFWTPNNSEASPLLYMDVVQR